MVDRSPAPAQPATPRSAQGGRPTRRFSNLLRRYSFSQLSQSPTDTASAPSRSGQNTSGAQPHGVPTGSTNSGSARLISPLRAAANAISTRAQSFDLGSSQAHEARTRATPSPIPTQESVNHAPPRTGATHKVRLAPYVEATRSLAFFPANLYLVEGGPRVQIGRFSDRNAASTRGMQNPSVGPASALGMPSHTTGVSDSTDEPGSTRQPVVIGESKTCVAFQSKVVSRLHAEIWCGEGGKVYLRDTKSSSGTFVNRIRLSPPGVLSRAFEVKDGDIVQFGIDYQGGSEDIFRAVKVRMEIDRDSSIRPTAYGHSILSQLQTVQKDTPAHKAKRSEKQSLDECCICLLKIRVCQALFIGPCSHMFHYKCIRPIMSLHYPGFSCPLCRTFADLEADLQDDTDDESEACNTTPHPKVPVANEHQGQGSQVPQDSVPAAPMEQEMHSPMSPCELSDASDAVAPFSTPLLPAAELENSPMARSDAQANSSPQYIPTGTAHLNEAPPSAAAVSAPSAAPAIHAPTSAPPLVWRSRAMSS